MRPYIGALHPAARRVSLRHFAPSQQRAWVTFILTNHTTPPSPFCDVHEETGQSAAEGAFPCGHTQSCCKKFSLGNEERGQASQHIPPFGLFLIQVCAANHAQDTGTDALDFLSDWGLRGKWSDRIWTWLFSSDGIVYVDIWAEQVHFTRAPLVMRNDRAGPLMRAWITWFISDHRIPRASERTDLRGKVHKDCLSDWLLLNQHPPQNQLCFELDFFPSRLTHLG